MCFFVLYDKTLKEVYFNQSFIAYKTNGYDVNINVNSYLFQEGTGDKYENARYSKVVLVGNKLRLIDLRDKDFKEIE